jgi:hypothetical protein
MFGCAEEISDLGYQVRKGCVCSCNHGGEEAVKMYLKFYFLILLLLLPMIVIPALIGHFIGSKGTPFSMILNVVYAFTIFKPVIVSMVDKRFKARTKK